MADVAKNGLNGGGSAIFPDPTQPALSTTRIKPVTVSNSTPGQVSLTVESARPGFVVLTDTFYPGWEATIDGQPAPIWPANLAFRAVAIPAGEHTVDFYYRPVSFRLGLGVSLASLLVVVGLGSLTLSLNFAH
jgi:uncharacterized membrane protein YfhO